MSAFDPKATSTVVVCAPGTVVSTFLIQIKLSIALE
jgi:hypothetical protein